MIDLTDHADLPDRTRAELARAVERLATLEEVIRWGLAHPEPRMILEVVVQDEFTHDAILEWRAGLYLVFDTG